MSSNTYKLEDGYATLITMANLPNVRLYEKEVTPPAFTGGGPIDTTTMRNSAWRTQAPKMLKTLGHISATVAYATEALESVIAQLHVNQLITVTFPDSSSVQFYGWLESFTPAAHREGELPTAEVVVQPSLVNDAKEETAPVYNEPTES
jgi:hypothetical protein